MWNVVGNTLLVGTRQGHLIIYALEEKESKCELTLMRTKLFSKKPIVQLEIIPEHDLLLSLSGKYQFNSIKC